jgi:hypothetical protein
MRFNKQINNTFTNPNSVTQPCIVAVGTINRLFVSDREYFGEHFLLEETSQNQFGKIVGHNGIQNFWTEVQHIHNNSFFTQKKVENEDLYNIEVNFSLSSQQQTTRDLVESILNIKNVIYLIQDSNLNWFLIGEWGGTVTTVDANLGNNEEGNIMTVLTKLTQRYLVREVSLEYINTYITPNLIFSLCDLTATELCFLTPEQLCNLLP